MLTAETLQACLPQTQCGECQFSGCMPYAEALLQGRAPIDRCLPGGVTTLNTLGALLRIDPTPYQEGMQAKTRPPAIAFIREQECIGCTKCIQACPVDAILGTGRAMHTVLTHECTGCGLCVEPCPVDCIDLIIQDKPAYFPEQARQRYEARTLRQQRVQEKKKSPSLQKTSNLTADAHTPVHDKKAYIAAALARVAARKKP